jgi:chromosome segregation ATPase
MVNGRWINSYSLLQDRFHEHMKDAGFTGFDRGERGSTAEHLSVLEYKSLQEAKRAAALDTVIADKEQAISTLDDQAAKKQKRIDKLDGEIVVKTKAAATAAEIEAMGKPALLGGVNVATGDMKTLKTLAKKSLSAHDSALGLKRRLAVAENELRELKNQFGVEKSARPSLRERLSLFDKLKAALNRAPKRLLAVIDDIMRQPPERQEPERAMPEWTALEQAAPEHKRGAGLEH